MAFWSRLDKAEHEGNIIEVECCVLFVWSGVTEFSLIINNSRVDRTQAVGACTLRGHLPEKNGQSKRVVLWIKQGAWSVRYKLEIDGVECPFTKVY